MTIPITTRTWIDPPEVEPVLYGLFSVATVVDGNGTWQINGVEYLTDNCARGGHVKGSCPRTVNGPARNAAATATPTPTAGTGHGYAVARTTGSTTDTITVTLDPQAPAPVAFDLTGPVPRSFTLQPGASRTYTLTAGTYALNGIGTGCAPVNVTVPFAAGTAPLGGCTSIAYDLKVANGDTSQAPFRYRVVGATPTTVYGDGVLYPGDNETVLVPPGTATVEYYAIDGTGQLATGTVTVPGTPVTTTVAVPDQGSTHHKEHPEGLTLVQGSEPFTVYARAECNAVGFPEASATALRRLELAEDAEVEQYFSTEILGADPGRQPGGTTAHLLRHAIGVLEHDALLRYNGRPVLHAPRWTLPYFADLYQFDECCIDPANSAAPMMRLRSGTRISFGAYDNNPADPAAVLPAGRFWLNATGVIRILRSSSFVNEAFDAGHPTTTPGTYTSSNTRVAIAERTFAIDHDCYRASVLVQVDTTAPTGGGL